jgi:hypothetical protein
MPPTGPSVSEILFALAIFISLVAASLGCLVFSERLPAHHRHDETYNVVRVVANIFVVLTSLVLGLLVNSSKNTFEAIDRNIHAFSTELILFDRTLRHYGPEASEVREQLRTYVRQAIRGTWGADGAPLLDDRAAENLLDEVGNGLVAIRPSDPLRTEIWRDAELSYQNVVRRRWALIEESEGAIPRPFLVMVVAWLVLIFASFGYRAPRNAVVITTFVASAFLIAGSIYLILDMNIPFSGPIKISPAPLQRAEEQMRR